MAAGDDQFIRVDLVLAGVYRHTAGEPVFQEARAPTGDELQGLLDKIIAAIEDAGVIVRILSHRGLPTRAPPRAAARELSLFQAA